MKRINQNGFTLLEIVIATGLLAVLMLGLTSLTTFIAEQREGFWLEGQKRNQKAYLLDRMMQDLGGAFVADVSFAGAEATQISGLKGDAQNLFFSSFTNRHQVKNAHDSDAVRVGYRLEASANGFKLMREQSRWLQADFEPSPHAYKILDGVKSLRFAYYDPLKKEWLADWDTTQSLQAGKLPAQIALYLEFETPQGGDADSSLHYVFSLDLFAKKVVF